MAAPKKGTERYKQVQEVFRATMIEKYGSYEAYKEVMRQRGSKGGSVVGVKKGFAANKLLAVEAGRRGGSISRRTGIKNGQGQYVAG